MELNTTIVSEFLYSSTSFLALPFEKSFSPEAYTAFAHNNYPICVSILIVYYLFFTYGKKYMDNGTIFSVATNTSGAINAASTATTSVNDITNAPPVVKAKGIAPFDLKYQLAIWNAFLCLFSFLGMCRTVPYLVANILENDYVQTVCSSPVANPRPWGKGPCGFWVMLFIFSKVPELIDTVFLVLRKKPVIFLHWYHHMTVLLFCWNAYASQAGSGLYFVAMNYSVHALMYGYYCLQALDSCPKSFPTILITISQITQMVIGTGVVISCWYFKLNNVTCHNDESNLVVGGIIYASYLYLFVEFFVKRYGPGNKKRDKKID